jgi:hypothetical protein
MVLSCGSGDYASSIIIIYGFGLYKKYYHASHPFLWLFSFIHMYYSISQLLYVSTCCDQMHQVPLCSVDARVGVTWGEGGQMPLQYLLYLTIVFWLLSRRGPNKKMV